MEIQERVKSYEEAMLNDLATLVSYNSVQGEPQPDAPFGEVPAACLDKALEILIYSPPPLDGLYDGGKTVVQQHNIAGLLGHLGAGDAHGDAHIRVFERRSVVDSVPGDRHHISQRF